MFVSRRSYNELLERVKELERKERNRSFERDYGRLYGYRNEPPARMSVIQRDSAGKPIPTTYGRESPLAHKDVTIAECVTALANHAGVELHFDVTTGKVVAR